MPEIKNVAVVQKAHVYFVANIVSEGNAGLCGSCACMHGAIGCGRGPEGRLFRSPPWKDCCIQEAKGVFLCIRSFVAQQKNV